MPLWHHLHNRRWGHTPLDDAVQFQRQDVRQYLDGHLAQHPSVAYSAIPTDFPSDSFSEIVYKDITDDWCVLFFKMRISIYASYDLVNGLNASIFFFLSYLQCISFTQCFYGNQIMYAIVLVQYHSGKYFDLISFLLPWIPRTFTFTVYFYAFIDLENYSQTYQRISYVACLWKPNWVVQWALFPLRKSSLFRTFI